MYIRGKFLKFTRAILFVAAIYVAATFSAENICFASSQKSETKNSANKNVVVPLDVKWQNKTIVNKDEHGREIKYVLNNKQVEVFINGKSVWVSDEKFIVQDMLIGDVDGEKKATGDASVRNLSKDELILLLWKEGRYGPHKPFWVKQDEKQYSQHIFLYNIKQKTLAPKWGSSYMGEVANEMKFINNTLFLTHKDQSETAWKWISFGFEKVEPVKFFVAGDNLIHDFIYKDALNNHGGDFEYLYKKVEKYTKEADFSVINLETPLVKDPKLFSTYPCFGSPVAVAKGIKDAGFDAVTLSNNHRLDKGITGIVETIETLDENNLLHVGSMDEKPYLLVKRNDIVFALLNYTYGTNGIKPPKEYENSVYFLEEDVVRENIREARENADIVIVFPHWGAEYTYEPNYYELKWRDIFYEEGVDVVVGTHPHVIQKYELYKTEDSQHKMLVFYSLGNYISGNQRSDHNSGGLAFFNIETTSRGPQIADFDFVEIDTIYSPRKY